MKKKRVNDLAEKMTFNKDVDRVILLDGQDGTLKKFDIHTHMKTYMDHIEAYYGVEWDTGVSASSLTRIGRLDLHQTLPIQSRMKGCLLDDTGNVTRYMNPSSWTSETRDGSSGQVMVEIPEFYYLFEADGTKRRLLISEYDLPGFIKMRKMYVSAYEASLQRSTSKLSSVRNNAEDYRGGDNNGSYDLLGRPATSISRSNFRTYARNRGAGYEMYTYFAHKAIYMLYLVEFADRNCQLPFNAALDAMGCRQGGLGDGVTTLSSTEWSNLNGYRPFVPCGHTDSLGNNSGVVAYTVPLATPRDVFVPRYRGIENPFGHIWKNCDGINVDVKTDDDGGTSRCYICDNPALFTDSSYNGYLNIGLLPRFEGYIKEMLFGEFMPLLVGGGSTTYWCDRFYTDVTSSSLRTVLFGGSANNGAGAGFGYSNSYFSPSYANAYFGSRLCFIA